MEKFEFNSAICTSVEQSKRLLELGLKKETADMVYHYHNSRTETMRWELKPHPPVLRSNCHFNIERLNVLKQKNSDGVVMSGEEYFDVLWGNDIPAWSLHRLIEMVDLKIQFRLKEKTTVLYGVSHLQPFQSFSGFSVNGKSYYNSIINAIEWLIKEGYFNKDYLEVKK